MYPRRSPTTHTEQLGDEASVFDWARAQVHALNPTAARVWGLCDGTTSRDVITAALARDMVPEAEAVVELTLRELVRLHLLDESVESRGDRPATTRRWLLRRGVTAAMLPVISSIMAPSPVEARSPSAGSATFRVTRLPELFTVRAGVVSITIQATGAPGGRGVGTLTCFVTGQGGPGSRTTATVAVTPGVTLTVLVGSAGMLGQNGGGGGFNGGGNGSGAGLGGGGGGASSVFAGATPLVIAGGGGGGGAGCVNVAGGNGGSGGGLIADPGVAAPQGGGGGGGGTQVAGGAGGAASPGGSTGTPGTPGVAHMGGTGGQMGGGGGGGGYFGGGGGGGGNPPDVGGSGGGGGSSFTAPGSTAVVHEKRVFGLGDGLVIISW